MTRPETKHLPAVAMIFMAMTGCHQDQYTKPDLTLLLISVEGSFSTTDRREIPLVDQTYLSTFPFRTSVTALTEEVTPEMIKAERPPALRSIFTLPMQIDANCLSSTCGDGMHLSGDAVMVVDLDQRLITLHQFDLRDMNYVHYLSGMM